MRAIGSCVKHSPKSGGRVIDLPARRVGVGDIRFSREERDAVADIMSSGRISEGRWTRTFERRWADFVGTNHAVAMNSGTSALIAGLSVLQHAGIASKGDRVITTPLTYVATSNAISLTGMEPVYADIAEDGLCIDPDSVKAAIEDMDGEASLILPVHLMGYPARMDDLLRLGKDHGLTVLEDSAQAHGTMYDGKRTGSWGLMSFYSFYIAHNIQAGELGAVNTDDDRLRGLLKQIKANGRACDCQQCTRHEGGCPKLKNGYDPRFTHELVGYNFKAMEFQTAIAAIQLEHVNEIIEKRAENVRYLNDGLAQMDGVLRLPRFEDDVSYLAYPLIIEDRGIDRHRASMELERLGVEVRPLFGCIPTQQPAYAHLRERYIDRLPNADHAGSRGIYVGCHQYLSTEDLDHVISSIIEVFGS